MDRKFEINVYRQIADEIKAVYGRALFEDITEHHDIIRHMDCVWEIIKNLHDLCQFA